LAIHEPPKNPIRDAPIKTGIVTHAVVTAKDANPIVARYPKPAEAAVPTAFEPRFLPNLAQSPVSTAALVSKIATIRNPATGPAASPKVEWML